MKGAIVALALVLPALLWLTSVGDPRAYLEPGVPSGQLAYVLSKLAGLQALSLLAMQLGLTAARGTRLYTVLGTRWSPGAHARLGLAVVALSVAHATLFVTAASLRSGHVAFGLLVPRWDSGDYDAMVSIGLLGLAAIVATGFAGARARRVGSTRRGPRRLHRGLVATTVGLVAVHSYAIGSETATVPGTALYAALGLAAACAAARVVRLARRS